MEYSKFIRLYYLEMLKIFKDKEFKPEIIREDLFFSKEKEMPLKKINVKEDNGFLGSFKLELDAPNSVYENYFEQRAFMYPEFGMLFLKKEMFIDNSKIVESIEEIREYLTFVLTVYEKMGLITPVSNEV